MRNTLFIIIGVAILVLAIAIFVTAQSGGQPVEAATVTTGPIQEFVEERGKTRLPHTWSITMPYAGRVKSLHQFAEGASVKKDQVVAEVVQLDVDQKLAVMTAAKERGDASIEENDDVTVEQVSLEQSQQIVKSMESTVQAARERVKSGGAKYEFAKRQLERIAPLWKNKTKTDEEYDAVLLQEVQSNVDYRQDQLVLSALEAMQIATKLMPVVLEKYIARKTGKTHNVLVKQRDEAIAQWNEAERDRRRGTMKSPIDGVVLERAVTDEQYLAAGTLLIRLGELEKLEVEVDVLSQDVVNVRERVTDASGKITQPGNRVELIGPAIGPTPVIGEVVRIYPAGFTKVSSLGVEQQRVKVIIAFQKTDLERLRKERNLGLDFRVRAKIITREKASALVIPRSALFRTKDGLWSVYAIRNGKAEMVKIEVGLMNDEHVEVLTKLQAGEQVVLAPETNLEDGTRVKPNDEEPAAVNVPAQGD
jgi:HlyD family secretion protein